jgi:hypothetical protein
METRAAMQLIGRAAELRSTLMTEYMDRPENSVRFLRASSAGFARSSRGIAA